ncbi:MAG: hypothetical protein HXY34_07285 [Candidatus Thorarchaeota archaeon]|nr:hypothetical protein [Candidatus Thorarchaeota archaeon]
MRPYSSILNARMPSGNRGRVSVATHQTRTCDHKVYVTGAFHAGKTTLVHALDPDAISVERDLREECRSQGPPDLSSMPPADYASEA